jgi:apolipoprotein D and lipocalin family protein
VILAALLALAACARPQPAGFRQADAPIWSAAAFAPGQASGTWRQVAAFAEKPGGCTPGRLDVAPAPGGLALEGMLCLAGKAEAVRGLAVSAGPGRLAVPGQEDWWVLWVDSGYRTLAIGTPSGRFGFVLDREGGAPDRLAAAREVFDFNGYRSGALQAF